ncbi:MAG TPA: methionyl-tRNA formyltransferase [Acidimicrobiia bacterium]|jgi:methionyl-tRNA formyltransferase
MRAAFLGTPVAAVPALAALVDVADVVTVVTRPDQPRGRSGRAVPPPVKVGAAEWGLRVAQPSSHDELLAVLGPLRLDIAVVVAYGRILRPAVLATTRVGFVNVHLSLLPRWRGPAPVERAILNGDPTTGVSLMLLDEGVDTGPVISAIETPIADDETGGSLTARLSFLGAQILDDSLPDYAAGRLQPAPQMAAGASQAPLLTKDEARITLAVSPDHAVRMVRAFHPRPGAWIATEDGRVEIESAAISSENVASGVIEASQGRPVLGLTGGSIELSAVRPEGRTVQSGVDWMNGRRGRAARLVAS